MKSPKIIIAVVVALLLGGTLITIRNNVVFRLVEASPSAGRVPTATIYINFEFNKELYEIDLDNSAGSEPSIVQKIELHGKRLRVKLGALDDGKNYSIKLRSIRSTKGKVIDFYDYNFTARYIPFEQLTQEEQKTILDDQQSDKAITADPIFAHTPYGGLHFKLAATVAEKDGKSTPILSAQILLSRADITTNREVAITQYKQEVGDYLQSKGIDPNTYEITYEVIEPSLY